MKTFIQLISRPDLRREMIGAGIAAVFVMALAFSHRTPRSMIAADARPLPVLATAVAGPWTLDLLRIEDCPQRKIAVAIIRAEGLALPGSPDPAADVSLPGFILDGGEWTGTAHTTASLSFPGAGGAAYQYSLTPGTGLIVLRFRGQCPSPALPLCLGFADRKVCFPPVIPLRVPAEDHAPPILQLGH